MDKQTLSQYGWIVVAILILTIMIAMATPFGTYVGNAVKSSTQGLFDVNYNALNSTELMSIPHQEFNDIETIKEPHGLYYGEIYSGMMDGALIEAVFYENTSAKMYINGNLETEVPAGYIICGKTEVDMTVIGFGIGIISDDGKQINIDGLILKLKEKMAEISTPFYVVVSEDENDPGMISKEKPDCDLSSLIYVTDDFIFDYTTIPRGVNEVTGWRCAHINTQELMKEMEDSLQVEIKGDFKVSDEIMECPTIPAYINGEPVKILSLAGNGIEAKFTKTPEIPETVVYLYETFSGWTSLTDVGVIPETVKYQHALFRGCISLTKIPQLPNTFTDLDGLFQHCTGLTGELEINLTNVKYIFQCFDEVDFEKQNITLIGTSDELLDMLGETGKNYCTECNGKCMCGH